jgi:hypothetical protein
MDNVDWMSTKEKDDTIRELRERLRKENERTADLLDLLQELYKFKLREDKGDPDYMPSDWWQGEVWERVKKELCSC